MVSNNKRGFTLLEMSVVLVIIGLLIGSVVIGRDLFISARDRSIIKEADIYKQAVQAFQNKYGQLPGDMVNPGQYWPGQAWSGDGNGDGIIVWSHEGPEAWLQLQLAGFIPASSISIACENNCAAQAGVNMPRSSTLGTAGWTIGVNNHTGQNVLMFGMYNGYTIATRPALIPSEAQYIDSKVDDGDPMEGNFRARNSRNFSECILSTNRHTYDLSQTDPTCNFDVILGL